MAVVAYGLGGCASRGYEQGDAAADGMRKAAMEVEAESAALDQAVAAMNTMVNEPVPDLRVGFRTYSQSLDRLIAAARRTESTGRKMEAKSALYLATWSRQLQDIDYGHIREVSDARWVEVTNRVEAINRRYRESQAAVQPLVSYLSDIRTALGADLTTAGLDSMKGVAQNAQNNVSKVQTSLDALAAELTNSSARLSSVAYQAPRGPEAPGLPRANTNSVEQGR